MIFTKSAINVITSVGVALSVVLKATASEKLIAEST